MTKKIKPSSLILRDGAADLLRSTMAGNQSSNSEDPVHSKPKVTSDGIYAIGQTYEVPVSDIRENNLNARAFYTHTEIDQMGQSMLNNGQEVPALGYVENTQVFLIDGQKRWRGANAIGQTTLRVEIRAKPESEKSAYLESRRINVERSGQTVLDDAVRFKYLIDNKVFSSQVELGAAIGIDQAAVSKTLSINAIPERIKRRMHDYPQLTQFRVACAISKIFSPLESQKEASTGLSDLDDATAVPPDPEALADNMIDEIIRSELSARQVEDLVTSRLTRPKKKIRSEIQNYKFAGQAVTVKVLPIKGKLDLSVKGLSVEHLEVLHMKLREMLKGETP